MEPQNQKLLSESKSDVWYQHCGTDLYELSWQVGSFFITKAEFLELLGPWKRIFGQQSYQEKARSETYRRYWLSHFLSISDRNDFNYCHLMGEMLCLALASLYSPFQNKEDDGKKRVRREGGKQRERERKGEDHYN